MACGVAYGFSRLNLEGNKRDNTRTPMNSPGNSIRQTIKTPEQIEKENIRLSPTPHNSPCIACSIQKTDDWTTILELEEDDL